MDAHWDRVMHVGQDSYRAMEKEDLSRTLLIPSVDMWVQPKTERQYVNLYLLRRLLYDQRMIGCFCADRLAHIGIQAPDKCRKKGPGAHIYVNCGFNQDGDLTPQDRCNFRGTVTMPSNFVWRYSPMSLRVENPREQQSLDDEIAEERQSLAAHALDLRDPRGTQLRPLKRPLSTSAPPNSPAPSVCGCPVCGFNLPLDEPGYKEAVAAVTSFYKAQADKKRKRAS